MLAALMLLIAGADASACEIRFNPGERHPQAVCADAGAQAALASRLSGINLPRDLQGAPPVAAALTPDEAGGWRIPTQVLAGPPPQPAFEAIERGWHPAACAVAGDVGSDGRASNVRVACAFGTPPGEMSERHVQLANRYYDRAMTNWLRAQALLPGDDGACFSTLLVIVINDFTWTEALENGWAEEPDPAALCAR
ncbi:hypothetical protein L2D01_10840 [Hyphomonadaceae bacterium ML37]|nr:hypothetical protein L2D01_10840 [Hyphomonadaceae bacterium ML37]